MNSVCVEDYEIKKGRVCRFLKEQEYDGVILARRDNFAWFTFGGDNKIFRSSEEGAAVLLITADNVYLFARSMDSDRIMDEELCGLPIRQITLKWYEDDPVRAAAAFIPGGKIAADIRAEGTVYQLPELQRLHIPYTGREIERYHYVGSRCDYLFTETARQIRPGMTEQEIAALLCSNFEREGMVPKVLLVGSDERIAAYRHPLPSGKKVAKTVLLHVASDCFGMHGNITRMISFGEIPRQLYNDYELLCRCQAHTFAMLRPGVRYQEILAVRKKLLAAAGKEFETDLHFPGAVTGYQVGGPEPIINNESVQDTMCYDWFITVTGAKTEELAMARPDGARVLSAAGWWPVKEYQVGDYTCKLPQIMVL